MNEGELNAYEFGDALMYELASGTPDVGHAVADFLGSYLIHHAALQKGDLVTKYAQLKKMAGGNLESFRLFQRHFIWCLGFLLLKLTPKNIANCEKEKILEYHRRKISAMSAVQLQQFLENVFGVTARHYAQRYAARERVRDQIIAMQDESSVSEFIPAATAPQNFHLLKHMGEKAQEPIFPIPAPLEWYATETHGSHNESPFLAAMERFQMVPARAEDTVPKLQHIEGMQSHTRMLLEFYQAFLSPELLDAFPLNRRISWEVDELGPAASVHYSFIDLSTNKRKAIEDLCAELVIALRAEIRAEKFADAPRPIEPLSMHDFFHYLYELKELCADFFPQPQTEPRPSLEKASGSERGGEGEGVSETERTEPRPSLEKKRAEAFTRAQQKLNHIRHWLVGVRGTFRGAAPQYEQLDSRLDPKRYARPPYGSSPLVYGYDKGSNGHLLDINTSDFPLRIQWTESAEGKIQGADMELFQLVRPCSLGGPIAKNLRLPVAHLAVAHGEKIHITDGEHPNMLRLKRYVEITLRSSPWWCKFVQTKNLSSEVQRAFVSYAAYGLYQLLAFIDAHEKDIVRARAHEAAGVFKMTEDGFGEILNRFSFRDFQGEDTPAASPQEFGVKEERAKEMIKPEDYAEIITSVELLKPRDRIPGHLRGELSPHSPLFHLRTLSAREKREMRFTYLLKKTPSALQSIIQQLENTDCGDLSERLINDVCIKTIDAINPYTPPETILNWVAYIGNAAFALFIELNSVPARTLHEKLDALLSRACADASENYRDRFPQLLMIYNLYYFGAALYNDPPGAEAFRLLHARVSHHPPRDFEKLSTAPPKLKVSRFEPKVPAIGMRMRDVMLIYPQLVLHLKTCFAGSVRPEKRAERIIDQYERFPAAMNFFATLLLQQGKAVSYLKLLMDHEALEYDESQFTRDGMRSEGKKNAAEKPIQSVWLRALKVHCSFKTWIPPEGVEKTAESYMEQFRDVFVTLGIFQFYDPKTKKIEIEKMPTTSFSRAVVATLPQLQAVIEKYITSRSTRGNQPRQLAANAIELFADLKNVCPE